MTMTKTIILSTVAIALTGPAVPLAQAQQQAPQMNPDLASFFVAENPNGTGNLGGLAGADQICQTQAQAIGGRAAQRTWHAYLSQEQRGATPRVNARDRIGSGPWYNVKGQLIASTVADLHGDQAGTRDRNNIQRATVLDAKGNEIPGVGSPPGGNQHDILTGSDPDGRAFVDGYDHTCNNWTSDAMSLPQANPNVPADRARAMLGHSDRSGGQNVSWNAAHLSQGCTKQSLINTGGAGRLYCFATN
jgi:Collagenase NC10 and Endostatin